MSDENGATVEWGSPAAERVNGRRWWPRLPVRTGGGDRRGRRTISPVALACAVVGFGLTLAAELLPWMTVRLFAIRDPNNGDPLTGNSGGGIDLGIDRAFTWQGLLYNVGWMVVLVFVGVALAVEPRRRRTFAAAGLGGVAGQLILLVGLARAINDGALLTNLGLNSDNKPPIEFGPGMYAAFAAVPVFVTALLLAARVSTSRGGAVPVRPAAQEQPGPVDLTVTPVSTPVWDQEPYARPSPGRLTPRD